MPKPQSAVELVKKAALDAVKASKPVSVLFGTVISAHPLKVQVDQRSIYTEKMLILSRSVTDYSVEMEVDHRTEESSGGAGDAAYAAHSHQYTGRKSFKICNALQVGERVLMLRVQGGKKFVVLDRMS